MSGEVLHADALRALLGDLLAADETRASAARVVHASDATLAIEVPASASLALLRRLREAPDAAWDRLVDLTIVDRLGDPSRGPAGERFEAIYSLRSSLQPTRLRVHVAFAGERPDEPLPELDSVVSLWPAADWLEREAGELFGLRFRCHPAWQRLLLPAEFEGAPLRKDFVAGPVDTR